MSNNGETKQIDYNIGQKYIKKDNMTFSNDYFGIVVLGGMAAGGLFFINPTIPMMVIGGIIMAFFIYLYKQKGTNLITSVTIYKYNIIFMEILFKNFRMEKDTFKKLKTFFNNKKKK